MTHYISPRQVESFGQTLIIEQNLENEHGASVWDGALVLAKYFENTDVFPRNYFKNKKILELGSGNGLIGIILALFGANVVITDLKKLLPLIELNVKKNCPHLLKSGNIRIQELKWGEDVPNEKFDMIVASDCVYDKRSLWLPFAKCLQQICEEDKTIVLLSYELRSKADAAFFPYIRQTFSVQRVPSDQLDEFWQADDIGIFYLKKLPKELQKITITEEDVLNEERKEEELKK